MRHVPMSLVEMSANRQMRLVYRQTPTQQLLRPLDPACHEIAVQDCRRNPGLVEAEDGRNGLVNKPQLVNRQPTGFAAKALHIY
jgi:hypothetical protein